MKYNFNYCLNRVLKDEGGYTDNPNDNGGPTNFGITLKDYQSYINKKGTAADVRKMDINDAKRIYKSKYWDAVGADDLPSGVDYTVFDYGVNSGVVRAKKVYNQFKDKSPVVQINSINDERLSFLKKLSSWQHFGKGWGSRVAGVRIYSLALVETSVPSKTSSGIGGIVAAAAPTAIALHTWGPHHWIEITASAGFLALLGGLIIHHYRKGKI